MTSTEKVLLAGGAYLVYRHFTREKEKEKEKTIKGAWGVDLMWSPGRLTRVYPSVGPPPPMERLTVPSTPQKQTEALKAWLKQQAERVKAAPPRPPARERYANMIVNADRDIDLWIRQLWFFDWRSKADIESGVVGAERHWAQEIRRKEDNIRATIAEVRRFVSDYVPGPPAYPWGAQSNAPLLPASELAPYYARFA